MADVGEEAGLGLVEGGQRGGPVPFLLVGAQVADGPGDLGHGQLQEVAVGPVHRQVAAHLDDQRAAAHPERQHLPARLGLDRGVVQHQPRERHIRRVLGEHRGHLGHQRVLVRRVGQPGPERAQRPQPALAQHPRGGVADDAEHAADLAGRRPDRVVGDVEIGLFEKAVPLQQERVVGGEEGGVVGPHPVEQILQHRPGLGPHVPAGPAQMPRMLTAHRGDVGVVVERAVFRPEEDDDLGPRGEHGGDRVGQLLRPGVGRPQRALAPVQLQHPATHLTAPRKRRRQPRDDTHQTSRSKNQPRRMYEDGSPPNRINAGPAPGASASRWSRPHPAAGRGRKQRPALPQLANWLTHPGAHPCGMATGLPGAPARHADGLAWVVMRPRRSGSGRPDRRRPRPGRRRRAGRRCARGAIGRPSRTAGPGPR